MQLGALKPPLLTYFDPPPNLNWVHMLMQLGPENKLQSPMLYPFYGRPNSAESSPGGRIVSSGLPNHRPAMFAPDGAHDSAMLSKNLSVPDVNSLNSDSQDRALELKDENRTPLAQPNGRGRYMLFGVNLFNSSLELPSPQVADSSELESHGSIPPTSQSSVSETAQVSDLSKSVFGYPSEMQCKNCSSFRRCTKVVCFFMHLCCESMLQDFFFFI